MTSHASISCTLVTGALGSGKTTVIRKLMERPEMAGTALIINEFGEVGLDHLLVASAVETTLLMENGCMCCTLRGDIVDTVLSLFDAVGKGEIPAFNRILIETTGLADPVPIVRDLSKDAALRDKVHLTRVVTCVDGLVGRNALPDAVAIEQVALADVCLVTKTDLADPLKLDELNQILGGINPMMTIVPIRGGVVPDLALITEGGSAGLGTRSNHDEIHSGHGHGHSHGTASAHGGVESWSIVIDHPIAWRIYADWFDLVYSLEAARMLRMKGILWIKERELPLLVQGVGPVITPLQFLDSWSGGACETKLVMITKGLSPKALATSFQERVLNARLH